MTNFGNVFIFALRYQWFPFILIRWNWMLILSLITAQNLRESLIAIWGKTSVLGGWQSTVTGWNREFVESPLEIQTHLDMILWNLLWWTCFKMRIGRGVLQRSLPVPAILGFWESSFSFSYIAGILLTAYRKNSRTHQNFGHLQDEPTISVKIWFRGSFSQ